VRQKMFGPMLEGLTPRQRVEVMMGQNPTPFRF
jgi:hypothetical protein